MSKNGNGQMVIKKISIDLIKPNPEQPRKVFNNKKIKLLAESFYMRGDVDYAILVTPRNDDENGKKYYMIIDGERRWRATKETKLKEISCQVHPKMPDEEIYVMSARVNLGRENLNPIEEARMIERLMSIQKLNQAGVARVISKSPIYVSNMLKYLKLHIGIQELLLQDGISKGVALQLSLYREEDQDILFKGYRVYLMKNPGKKLGQNEVQRMFIKLASKKGFKHRPLNNGVARKYRKRKTYEELVVGNVKNAVSRLIDGLQEFSSLEETEEKISLESTLALTERLETVQSKISNTLHELSTLA